MCDENSLFFRIDVCDYRNPLSSSSIACIFVSFGFSVVSDTLFDLFADVSHLGLVLSVHISSSFDEG